VLLLPWLQTIILSQGWRASCVAMGLLVLVGIAPLAFLVRKSPAEIGQNPDGDTASPEVVARRSAATIVDPTR
jgi:hypothetical protein